MTTAEMVKATEERMNKMAVMVAKINEAINAGMEATCDSHRSNKGISLERLTTGYTAKTKRSYPNFVMMYHEDIERLYNLALAFLGQSADVKLWKVNGQIYRGTEQAVHASFAGCQIAPYKFLALKSEIIDLTGE